MRSLVAEQLPVVVVGGGLSGCACALAMAGRGIPVILFEAGSVLGGRVQSVNLKGIEQPIDNCQHAAFRIYGRFLQLLATCDARGAIKLQKKTKLPYLEVDKGRISIVKSGSLPPPYHLAMSLMKVNFLSLNDKIPLRKALKAFKQMDEQKRRSLDDMPFQEWLEQNGQTERTIRRFWDPLVKAALNIGCEEASTSAASFLFQRGIFGEKDAFDVASFTSDLSNSIAPALRRTLARTGVEVRTSMPVTELFREERKVTGVMTREGVIPAAAVVLCTPISTTARLLTGKGADVGSFEVADRLANLGNTALIGIHAFHEGPVLPDGIPFVTCCDEPLIQMLFDRTAELDKEHQMGLPGHWITVPVSHADLYLDWDNEMIRNEYERVVQAAFPNVSRIKEFHVVRAKRATTALRAGSQRNRPSPLDAEEGVILGGDWLDIDWPSTMEGATRAGLTAASIIIEQRGDLTIKEWHHDKSWPDWPDAPKRGAANWKEW